MSRFLHHEPCPKCHSRDNLGVWEDGHKWCFGCNYYVPPERTIENSRKIIKEEKNGSSFSIDNLSMELPSEALKWLKSYGITDEEIRSYGCIYEHRLQYLLFPKGDGGWIGRYFGKSNSPRYRIFGKVSRRHFYSQGGNLPGIFCEDIISGIKIARQYSSCPVLGSHISLEDLLEASRTFKEIGIWLDYDMKEKVARIAQKARFLTGSKVFRIHTPKDPKCYSDEEIRKYVEECREKA